MLGVIIGSVGILWGVYTYNQSQILKRKEIIFPLIDEYRNEPSKLDMAKLILDDFNLIPQKNWWWKTWYYHQDHLKPILRDHTSVFIEDPGEIAIRGSFDSLLAFFGKLAYLYKIGLIHRDDLLYFRYFINKAANHPAVIEYARIYNFELFALLLYQLDINPGPLMKLVRNLV
jgi:hypothetical protein